MTKRPTQRTSTRSTRFFARILRQEMTEAEKVLWERLRNRRLGGYKFRRQHPIGPFITDFFCAEEHLVVEIDGGIHHETERRNKDMLRAFAMKQHGLRIIRFDNGSVINATDAVLESILSALSPLPTGERRG